MACCDSWGRRVRHDWATELNWTELSAWWRKDLNSGSLSHSSCNLNYYARRTNFYGEKYCDLLINPNDLLLSRECTIIFKILLYFFFKAMNLFGEQTVNSSSLYSDVQPGSWQGGSAQIFMKSNLVCSLYRSQRNLSKLNLRPPLSCSAYTD